MDFPIFHLDFLGDRILIAIIAVLHVLINHSLAVGFIPMVSSMELIAYKNNDAKFDQLAYRLMAVGFVITTTVGAMTGVGIWFASSLINPYSIGSLIRVFFFAWFTEWIVFVTEVVLILWYFLSWKKSNRSFKAKGQHIHLGFGLSTASWLTMAIIVAILGFMMDPGNWMTDRTLLAGFTNPIYLPQLLFRTPLAMMMAGTVGLFLTPFFTERGEPTRRRALRFLSSWVLIWTPFALAASYWYYQEIPQLMLGNIQVAVGTQQFQAWYDLLRQGMVWALGGSALIAGLTYTWPERMPRLALAYPVLVLMAFLGLFERIREFIRKPFVIGEYMYSNTIRADEYPLLQRDGLLQHATYTSVREITEDNQVEAGANVFMIACSRCHTTYGINSIVDKFDQMYGGTGQAFSADAMEAYIGNMHNARYFMPPFPGNEAEMKALIAYIKAIQAYPQTAEGAQDVGATALPLPPLQRAEITEKGQN